MPLFKLTISIIINNSSCSYLLPLSGSYKKPKLTPQAMSKSLKTTKSVKLARQSKMYCLRHMREIPKCTRNKHWTNKNVDWDGFGITLLRQKKNEQIYFSIEGGKTTCAKCFQTPYMISRSCYYRMLQKYQKSGATTEDIKRQERKQIQKVSTQMTSGIYYRTDKMPDTGYLMLPYRSRMKAKIVNYKHCSGIYYRTDKMPDTGDLMLPYRSRM